MAVDFTGRYLGDLKAEVTHGPSGAKVVTVPPVDNQGDGSSFSPTDLVAAALGTCMLSLISIVGTRDGLDLSGLTFRAEKHMSPDTPRRIVRIPVTIQMPHGLPPEQRRKLERAALTCPVSQSLHPDLEKVVTFIYEDEAVEG
jgi:putative redox protein